jgi:predicted nucleic acid-binding protein
MSDSTCFLDTNTLVYANDTNFPEKQAQARMLVSGLIASGKGCMSTQVLEEFWVTVTRNFKKPLSAELARQQIALFNGFTIIAVDHAIFLDALAIQERYQLSFWDAQIIAAARRAGCTVLYSEDLQAGSVLGNVRVVNPFEVIPGNPDGCLPK